MERSRSVYCKNTESLLVAYMQFVDLLALYVLPTNANMLNAFK